MRVVVLWRGRRLGGGRGAGVSWVEGRGVGWGGNAVGGCVMR